MTPANEIGRHFGGADRTINTSKRTKNHSIPVGIEGFLSRLDGVRQTSTDRWIAHCPAHDDNAPSLSIRDTGERVLVWCGAGCVAADIVTAVGLDLRDLFARPLDSQARREYAAVASQRDLEAALDHEILIMAMTLGRRVVDRKIPKERMPEGWAPMPAGAWEREIQAARRIMQLLPQVYDLTGRAAA